MVKSLIQLLLLSLLLVVLLRGGSGWKKWLRRAAGAMAAAALLFMTPNILHRSLTAWENGDWDLSTCQQPLETVVVLPGGTSAAVGEPLGWRHLSPTSIHRLEAGLELFANARAQKLLIAGNAREIRIMSALALRSGIAPEQLLTDSESYNTWLASRWVAEQSNLGRISLVTSALHMRRALWSFERNGLAVCPRPADREGLRPRAHWLLPKASDTRKADRLLHEMVGMVWYSLKYRSGEEGE